MQLDVSLIRIANSACNWLNVRTGKKSASGPLPTVATLFVAAVQLPNCGHSFGVRHLDDGLAAVATKPDIRVSRASRIQSGK